MKEENITIILDALLTKNDSCTMREVYNASMKYVNKHPDTYIDHSGDTIEYYLETYFELYFWDHKAKLIRRQELIKCKFCGKEYRKYPNTAKFEEIIKSNAIVEVNKRSFSEQDIHNAFMAGLNRGVYVASVIKREPIEDDYPSYEEYVVNLINNK